ncbi:class E basic helix-loop-helix protein 40-like [Eucyclogobius newberryi]|uniref:class E basic helix-loop-helix protein 40-like n=1 Tax=Eucyclogobius newberryi TaxID=166745 RepID=UPI003B5A77BE
MDRIVSAPPPPLSTRHSDTSEGQGMDFPVYVYKPRRGMKRGEESKDTYKLPHRLIEKKRRDRINECIAQLKDLLPEHLKLTTLGHLEKAVVLELTLKHVKTLSTLLEQQQQKILALQSGSPIEPPVVSQGESEEMFRSGFHMCAKEVLQYIANHERDGDFSLSHVINHLHKVASEVLRPTARPSSPKPGDAQPYHHHHQKQQQQHPSRNETSQEEAHPRLSPAPKPANEAGYVKNCVSVIQRAHAAQGGEQSGSDTDTDSGYGGELEKGDSRAQAAGRPEYYAPERHLKRASSDMQSSAIKQEEETPRHKRQRAESSEDEVSCGESSSSSSSGYASYSSASPTHGPPPAPHPLCMPFYLIPPSAAAYLPMLEKCWYPGAASIPMLYPGMGGSSPAGERPLSPRGGSPAPASSHLPMDSPALLQALKHVPPLNQETKE